MLDILVQERRYGKAAKRFLQTPTDWSALCSASDRDQQAEEPWRGEKYQLLPDVRHRQSRYLNNGSETTVQRLQSWQGRSAPAPRLLIYPGHFHPRQPLLRADA